MEVVTASPTTNGGMSSPFHDHDVREWSRLNSFTGVLERARIETDRWTSNTNNGRQNYGKVVDSRARTDVDGAVQQRARRQLEVFQSHIPGGRLQVIKTHSVSSSRWTNKTPLSATTTLEDANVSKDFENLQLTLNPLDLSSQKSKAIVGRSVGRRPPTRSRIKDDLFSNVNAHHDALKDSHLTAAANLQRVRRLCHQIHDNAVKQSFGNHPPWPTTKPFSLHEQKNGDLDIAEIESISSRGSNETNSLQNGHGKLSRTKSSSSEDLLLTKTVEDLEDLEQLQSWRRTSKVRRSFQHPKQNKDLPSAKTIIDLPPNSVSVRKIKEDLEKGRRLNTALRGNSIDFQALDQILQSISSSSSMHSDNASVTDDQDQIEALKEKRNSFVSVETLQEVKGRLRHTSTTEKDTKMNGEVETDDGIVTEDQSENITGNSDNSNRNRVRSYIYGMETMLNKKPVLGTGSLESRSKFVNSFSNNRSEDWYNRRKSYGFEQVENQTESISKTKNVVESSTDSGICRSSEIVVSPMTNKIDGYVTDVQDKEYNFGSVKKLTSIFNKNENNLRTKNISDELNNSWGRNRSLKKDWLQNGELKSTMIKIPIVSPDDVGNEMKRHSIAVDETKYVTQINNNNARRTSLIINDKFQTMDNNSDDPLGLGRKSKKVEFCKTEVHFAAESGRVNIVETDEKPPPTQNFRRRRRHSASNYLNDAEKQGLPVIRFGEDYNEKYYFGNEKDLDIDPEDDEQEANRNGSQGLVTVNLNNSILYEDEKRDYFENENIKGILKNKPIKPRPYLLGDLESPFKTSSSDEEYHKWQRRLRPGDKDPPIWKSTVRVSSTLYDENTNEFSAQNVQSSDSSLTKDSNVQDNLKSNKYPSDSVRSVADRIQAMEDQKNESRGYSTRVNFGDGETTVVENNIFNANKTKNEFVPSNESKDKSEQKIDRTEKESRYKLQSRNKRSPEVLRKFPSDINKPELKTATPTEKLSSPFLVGKSYVSHKESNIVETKSWSSKQVSNLENVKPENSFINSDKVLRQPKQSELAYFGVKSPQTPRYTKAISKPVILRGNKPDLLQHSSPKPLQKKRASSPLPLKKSESPLYENLSAAVQSTDRQEKKVREFDPSILEELTKAADQIVQAVNDYSNRDRFSSDEDEEKKVSNLDTIKETSSWHRDKVTEITNRLYNNKTKLKPTSSNSSVEITLSKNVINKTRKMSKTQQEVEKDKDRFKQKSSSETSSLKANVKARRLQRASSREALLQSHGSSSEDIPNKIQTPPIRKPRLIKKTKTSQFTMTNGIELSKKTAPNPKHKEEIPKSTTDEKIPGILPEIRHKTAISTIRSTTEKANRDHNRQKTEEYRKKLQQKKDGSKGATTTSYSKPEKNRNPLLKETVNHKIATANIKKCHRSEGLTRH